MRLSSIAQVSLLAGTLALGGGSATVDAHPLTAPAARPGGAGPRVYGGGDRGVRRPSNFYFTRAKYTDIYGRGPETDRSWWSTDYPKADEQLLVVLQRLTNLDVYPREHPVALDDPELRHYPFLYTVEAGHWSLTDAQVEGLRSYLLAGGFLWADDFWGTYEWRNFEANMKRVFPEYPIVEIPLDHELFHTYYDIDEIVQVPNVGLGMAGGRTFEQDGYVPHVRGIFDAQGRLMVGMSWNSDLGDAWEWAEQARYPLKYSTYAFQLTTNFIVYAMSH